MNTLKAFTIILGPGDLRNIDIDSEKIKITDFNTTTRNAIVKCEIAMYVDHSCTKIIKNKYGKTGNVKK